MHKPVAKIGLLLLLGGSVSTSANADNFCSYGHGSGGGGMVETADGGLALPDHVQLAAKMSVAKSVEGGLGTTHSIQSSKHSDKLPKL
ncbi:MAG: hypothetical protein AB8B94_09540 [Hyphomicrobiales bacterium]